MPNDNVAAVAANATSILDAANLLLWQLLIALCKKGFYTLCITLITSVKHVRNENVTRNIAYNVSIRSVIQYCVTTLSTQCAGMS